MPKLKQMTCSVELDPGNIRLKEYATRYSDGHVETFIAVPEPNIGFTIHLKSEGLIGPGLACFVFIDGEYQCNRNRVGLSSPGHGIAPSEYEVEFRFRQREEKRADGNFIARDWSFAKLDKVAADHAPKLNPRFIKNVGTIEIVVLRCKMEVNEFDPPRTPWMEQGTPSAPGAPLKQHLIENAEAIAVAKSTISKQSNGVMSGFGLGIFDGTAEDITLNATIDSAVIAQLDGPHEDVQDRMKGTENYSTHRISAELSDMTYYTVTSPGGPRNAHVTPFCAAMQDYKTEIDAFNKAHTQHDFDFDYDFLRVTLDQMLPELANHMQNIGNNPAAYPYAVNEYRSIIQDNIYFVQYLRPVTYGSDPLHHMPRLLREALVEIELVKMQTTCACMRRLNPSRLTDSILRKCVLMQKQCVADVRLRKDYNRRNANDRQEIGTIFSARIDYLKDALLHVPHYLFYELHPLHERIRQIMQRVEYFEAGVKETKRVHHDNESRARKGHHHTSHPIVQPNYQHNNGRNLYLSQYVPPNVRHEATNGQGWQQLGIGTWQPNRVEQQDQTHHTSHKTYEHDFDKSRWTKRAEADHVHNTQQQGDQDNKSQKRDTFGQPNNDAFGQPNNDAYGQPNNATDQSEEVFGQPNNEAEGQQNDGEWADAPQQEVEVNNAWAPDTTGQQDTTGAEQTSNKGSAAIKEGRASTRSQSKSYWNVWNKLPNNLSGLEIANKRDVPRPVYSYPKQKLPAVPEDKVKDASHGMQVSKGVEYSHKCRKPAYIDSMESPYAVFSFKYRSKEALEALLNITVDEKEIRGALKDAEKARFMSMSKHNLVEELMKKRSGGRPQAVSTFENKNAWDTSASKRSDTKSKNAWETENAPQTQQWDSASQRDSKQNGKSCQKLTTASCRAIIANALLAGTGFQPDGVADNEANPPGYW